MRWVRHADLVLHKARTDGSHYGCDVESKDTNTQVTALPGPGSQSSGHDGIQL